MDIANDCFCLFDKEKIASSNIEYIENTRLSALIKKCEEGGKNQLENAQLTLNEILNEQNNLSEQLIGCTDKYHAQVNELEALKQLQIKLSKTPNNPTERLEELIKKLRFDLDMHKKLSNIHFDYCANAEFVSGYISVKDDIPEESKLECFMLKPDDPDIKSKLWEKMLKKAA